MPRGTLRLPRIGDGLFGTGHGGNGGAPGQLPRRALISQ